jgi:site-specific recombinase XerD
MTDDIVLHVEDATAIQLRIEEDRAKVRANIAHARAPKTLVAYQRAFDTFSVWCADRAARALPAAPESVAAFLAHLGEEGLSLSTIEQTYAALAFYHRKHACPGWEGNGAPQEVKLQLDALRRIIGRSQKQKEAVTIRELAMLIGEIDRDSIVGLRDRAMFLLGFWSASRRSEVVALDVGNIVFTDEGFTMHLEKSKTDQEKRGYNKGVPFCEVEKLCPVRALRAWIDETGVSDGPLFWRVDAGASSTRERLGARSYIEALKRYCKVAGLDAANIAGHSLRAGFVTTAAAAGKDLDAIMRQTGHTDVATVRKYIRHATMFEHNAADGLVGQLAAPRRKPQTRPPPTPR